MFHLFLLGLKKIISRKIVTFSTSNILNKLPKPVFWRRIRLSALSSNLRIAVWADEVEENIIENNT